MSDILNDLKNFYEKIHEDENQSNKCKIYTAKNKNTGNYCFIKVMNK